MHNLKRSEETTYSTRPTIFDTLLDPAANRGHPVPSDAVLTSEAVLMLLAGTDTTANTLTVATYATLCNPQTRQRLLVELKEAMPTQKDVDTVTTQKLRSLPYLVRNAMILSCVAFTLAHVNPRVHASKKLFVYRTVLPDDYLVLCLHLASLSAILSFHLILLYLIATMSIIWIRACSIELTNSFRRGGFITTYLNWSAGSLHLREEVGLAWVCSKSALDI